MKVAKNLLLSCAALMTTAVCAQAADLPQRKSAPVEYVKICDAYGAGFFYIPGTDTCIRVGGMVQFDTAYTSTPYKMVTSNVSGATSVAAMNNNGGGYVPSGGYIPGDARDTSTFGALGRLELDTRTQSPWGTVRAFMRVDSFYGSGATANTGSISNSVLGAPTYLGTNASRETTTLNKAFMQFAGLTAGRIQSMFDFYADAIGYTSLRGSNQTVDGLGYTATFADGISGTFAVEDSVSHRSAVNSVAGYGNTLTNGLPSLTAVPSTSTANVVNKGQFVGGVPAAQLQGTRVPDLVANLRYDQQWGAIQLSGAAHQVRTGLWANGLSFNTGPTTIAPGFSPANSSTFGYALQGGIQYNLSQLAPGDKIWVQAVYARGAVGYTSGNNLNYINGVNTSSSYGLGLGRISSGNGWSGTGQDYDCVFNTGGVCEKSESWAVTAALRHYWTPTISSTLSGSWYQVRYSNDVINSGVSALAVNTGSVPFMLGMTNYRESIIASGLAWNPVKNFELGAEFAWQHAVSTRPEGLAQDAVLRANGLPAFRSTADVYRGRLRLLRAF